MMVRDLIEQLNEMPQDAEVLMFEEGTPPEVVISEDDGKVYLVPTED